jgi:hypothetical protein
MVSIAGEQAMTKMGREPPVTGSAPDPVLQQRLQDPVFSRAFDEYRDVLARRALWVFTKGRSRGVGRRDRGTPAG